MIYPLWKLDKWLLQQAGVSDGNSEYGYCTERKQLRIRMLRAYMHHIEFSEALASLFGVRGKHNECIENGVLDTEGLK